MLPLAGLMATACVTMSRPRGEWPVAVAVPVGSDSLAGATVRVDCGKGEQDVEAWQPAVTDGCRGVGRIIRGMGASVVALPSVFPAGEELDAGEEVDLDQATVDFTVRYVDRGGSRDWCGWTAPLFILSFAFFPCIEDLHANAEVQIVSPDGRLVQRQPLNVEARVIYGVPALYFLSVRLVRLGSHRARKMRLTEALAQYVRNLALGQWERQRLATQRAPAPGTGRL
jgi:hypothetical protein